MNNPEETADVESQTAGLYINLVVGSAVTVISLVVFELIRKRVPSVFDARRVLNSRKQPLEYDQKPIHAPPDPPSRFLAWIRPCLALDLDALAETHGYDTALFLRYLRSMMFLFVLLHLPAAVLLPVYYTATNKDLPADDSARTLGVQMFSLSNVSRDDPWRFWVTLAIDYFVVVLTLFVIQREFVVYARNRIRYFCSNNPANYTIMVQDIPADHTTDSSVMHYWQRVFPQFVTRAYYVYSAKILVSNINKFWKAVSARESAEWNYANNRKLNGERPTHKTGACSCLRPKATKVDSIDYWRNRQEHYANKVSRYQEEKSSDHLKPTRSAFVTFKDRRTAAVAAQTNYADRESEWRVCRAPEPRAVNWNALSIPGYQSMIRNSITILAAMALTIFWVIPVTFIMSLTSLRALVELEINGKFPFQWLDGILGWPAVVIGFIEGFLPAIVLSVFLGLVPTFLRLFVVISRIPSKALVDRNVRDWYFNFVVFSNFAFVIISGSLFNQLVDIVEEPKQLASILASSAPKQGAFLMNFVLLKAISETPKEILQIGRVAVRWIMLKFIAKTKRQRDKAEVGNSEFLFFRYYAISQLIALLGLIYSSISPFIIPCCLLYFIMMYLVFTYSLNYSLHNEYQDGGSMYGGSLYALWTGLFLHLVTMVGLFGLNKNAAQSILIIIPAVASLAYLLHARRSFSRICEHGSSTSLMKRIEVTEEDVVPKGFAELYMHPGMVPLPDPVPNLSGADEPAEKGESTPTEEGNPERDVESDPDAIQRFQQSKSDDVWVDAFSGYEQNGRAEGNRR